MGTSFGAQDDSHRLSNARAFEETSRSESRSAVRCSCGFQSVQLVKHYDLGPYKGAIRPRSARIGRLNPIGVYIRKKTPSWPPLQVWRPWWSGHGAALRPRAGLYARFNTRVSRLMISSLSASAKRVGGCRGTSPSLRQALPHPHKPHFCTSASVPLLHLPVGVGCSIDHQPAAFAVVSFFE